MQQTHQPTNLRAGEKTSFMQKLSCSSHTGFSHYQGMFCQVWERTSHRSAYGCVLLIKNENNCIEENLLKYTVSPKNLN